MGPARRRVLRRFPHCTYAQRPAAGGAFLNLAYHAQMKALPKNIIVAHAVLAVAGFGLLAVAAFR